jgi:DNA-directed RNA polymerase subunit beta'
MTKARNQAYRRADIIADRIRRGAGSEKQKKQKVVEVYNNAAQGLSRGVKLKNNNAGRTNNVMDMMTSGARGNPDQVKQMVASVGVLMDHLNRPVEEPVRGTYAEGLDTSEFFTHMLGSRKGMIDKSQSVRGPGALTKQVVVSATRYRVSMPDCGTTEGIDELVSDSSALDRYLAHNVPGVGSRNTVVTSATLSAARNKKLRHLRVRSALSCKAASGVCAKCYGVDEEGRPPDLGSFVGIKDSQALTEPSTQLALKTFHTGGVITAKEGLTTTFDKVQRLFTMPKVVKGSAVLSEVSGVVQSITPTVLGQKEVIVSGKRHKIPRGVDVTVRTGQSVKAGEKLTSGDPMPQDSLRLRGLKNMQLELRDQIRKIYADGGVSIPSKTVELPVKMLTDSIRVVDAGDHPGLVGGDYARFSQVASWNKENKDKSQVSFSHQLPGSEFLPHKSDDWALRMAHNRLEGMLRDEGPAMGYTSSLKDDHPFASLMTGEARTPRMAGKSTQDGK